MPSQIKVDEIKNVAGQYEIKTNTLKGQTTAGSITVQGEGTATTNLQQGLAKSWIARLNTGDATFFDSLNVGSTTDSGTGRITVTFTNDFSSMNFCVVMGVESNYPYKGYPVSASTMFLNTLNSANSHADGQGALTAHGDLA